MELSNNQGSRMKDDNKEMQPVMLSVVEDARMGLNKAAQMINTINNTLSSKEIVELKNELEGLSYTFMMIVMNAEIELEEKSKEVK